MSNGYEKAMLETINDGKAINKFNFELKRAIQNCMDGNTSTKKPRKVILEMTLKPDETRESITSSFEVKTKLCPDVECVDLLMMSQSGKAYVANTKQMDIEDQLLEIEQMGAQESEEISG